MKLCKNCKHHGETLHGHYCYRKFKMVTSVVTGCHDGDIYICDIERDNNVSKSGRECCGPYARFYVKNWWRFWE